MRVSNQNIGSKNLPASKSPSVPQSLPVDKPRLTLAIKTFKEKVLEWLSCSAGDDTNDQKHKILQLFEQMHESLNSWNSSENQQLILSCKTLGYTNKDYLFMFY